MLFHTSPATSVTRPARARLVRTAAVAAVATTVIGVAACSDDDSSEAASATVTETVTTAATTAPVTSSPADITSEVEVQTPDGSSVDGQPTEDAGAATDPQVYTGWATVDDAVTQLDAWGISCTPPASEDDIPATNCGDSSSPLLFGDRESVHQKFLAESGLTEEETAAMYSVSDAGWTMICTPTHRETCDAVAGQTGLPVTEGI